MNLYYRLKNKTKKCPFKKKKENPILIGNLVKMKH